MAKTKYTDVTGLSDTEIQNGTVILKDGSKSVISESKKRSDKDTNENGTKSRGGNSRYSANNMQKQFAASEKALDQRFTEQSRGEMLGPNKFSQRYNYETYQYDYYCGSQAKVFFGDIWVDDVVTIQYSIKQSKEPIYSYASQYFDAVAMGQVIGDGIVVIAFKEVGYFNVIRAYMEEQKLGTQMVNDAGVNAGLTGAQIAAESVKSRLGSVYDARSTSDIAASLNINGNFNPGLIRQSETIEVILDKLHNADLQVERTIEKGPNGSRTVQNNNVNFNSSKYKSKDFEDAAEVLEDLIWGDSNGQVIGLGKEHHLLRADEFDYIKNGKGEAVGIKSALGDNYEEVFNILVTFGDISDKRAEHTLTMLNDVHFTGHSVMINPDGNPIGEVYNFFFRDINKTINTNNVKINPLALRLSNNEMFNLSSMQDMENLLDPFIGAFLVVNVKNYYDGSKWVNWQNQLDLASMNMDVFYINNTIGTTQSVIRYVEAAINEMFISGSSVPDRSINMERFAVEVSLKYGINEGGIDNTTKSEKLYFLADRVSDIGHQYRIDNPAAPGQILDVIRREDFFAQVPSTADTAQPKANTASNGKIDIDEKNVQGGLVDGKQTFVTEEVQTTNSTIGITTDVANVGTVEEQNAKESAKIIAAKEAANAAELAKRNETDKRISDSVLDSDGLSKEVKRELASQITQNELNDPKPTQSELDARVAESNKQMKQADTDIAILNADIAILNAELVSLGFKPVTNKTTNKTDRKERESRKERKAREESEKQAEISAIKEATNRMIEEGRVLSEQQKEEARQIIKDPTARLKDVPQATVPVETQAAKEAALVEQKKEIPSDITTLFENAPIRNDITDGTTVNQTTTPAVPSNAIPFVNQGTTNYSSFFGVDASAYGSTAILEPTSYEINANAWKTVNSTGGTVPGSGGRKYVGGASNVVLTEDKLSGMTLFDVIAVSEGTNIEKAKAFGYTSAFDVTLAYGRFEPAKYKDKNITDLTISEVKDYQQLMKKVKGNLWATSGGGKLPSSAIGRGMFVEGTLDALVTKVGLKPTDKFSEENQRKIETQALLDAGYEDYIAGNISQRTFQNRVAKTWVSVKDISGRATTAQGSSGVNFKVILPILRQQELNRRAFAQQQNAARGGFGIEIVPQ